MGEVSRSIAETRSARYTVGALLGTSVLGLALASAVGCGSFAARGMNAEGVRLFEQARYQEAIRQFQQAVFSDPNNADGYYNLAAAYHRLGTLDNKPPDLAQAERYYNQCLDRAPDHRECHRGLAALLMQQGRRAEAFRLLEGWVDRSPGSAEPKIELARLCEETGDLEAAKRHLIDSLKVDERNARALAALGRIREQVGETREALLAYQRSLWHDRFQPEVQARLAALQSAVSLQPSASGQPVWAPASGPAAGSALASQPAASSLPAASQATPNTAPSVFSGGVQNAATVPGSVR